MPRTPHHSHRSSSTTAKRPTHTLTRRHLRAQPAGNKPPACQQQHKTPKTIPPITSDPPTPPATSIAPEQARRQTPAPARRHELKPHLNPAATHTNFSGNNSRSNPTEQRTNAQKSSPTTPQVAHGSDDPITQHTTSTRQHSTQQPDNGTSAVRHTDQLPGALH